MTTAPIGNRRKLVHLIVLASSWVTFACSTTTIRVESAPLFREGVVTAAKQTREAFAEVNRFLRERQVDRASRAEILSEDSFPEALSSDDLSKWQRSFAVLETYASSLTDLLDERHRAEAQEELRSLGEQLRDRDPGAFPDGIAGAFVSFAGLLVSQKAQDDAREILLATDPAVQDILSMMSEAIGASSMEGVRGTVHASWQVQLGRLSLDFRDETLSDAARLEIARKFANSLNERDAHDRTLAALRDSYLTLAQAHEELARGDRLTSAALIRFVQDDYEAMQQERRFFRSLGVDDTTKTGESQ